MVYTLLSGPMVYTLFPCFPRKMVYRIHHSFFLLCDLATDRERRGAAVVVHTPFSLPLGGPKDSAKYFHQDGHSPWRSAISSSHFDD